MSFEQYEPSEEEMKQAEESMTEEQEIRSGIREQYSEQRQKSGIEQTGDAQYDGSRKEEMEGKKEIYDIKGKFNNHDVSVTRHSRRTSGGMLIGYDYIAKIDSVPLSKEEARNIGERVFSYADATLSEHHEANKAVMEFNESEQKKAEQEARQKEYEDSRVGIEKILADFGF